MKTNQPAGYADFFLIPVQKRNLPGYKKLAKRFAALVKKYGAIDYRECVGEDLKNKGMGSFADLIKTKPGEKVVAAYVLFRSKSHRDSINKKLMNDPEMKKMMEMKPLFDFKRMHYGGFRTVVNM